MDLDTLAPSSTWEWRRTSIARRTLGWIIDYVLVLVPATILISLAVTTLIHALPSYVGAVAAEYGWSHLVRLITHGAGTGSLGAAASKEWVMFSAPLIGALLLVPLIQFAYQAILLGWRGRTVGMMLTDTRVVVAALDPPRLGGRVARRRALITAVLESGLVCTALAVVVLGQFAIGLLIWAVAVLAFWVNALAAFGPRRRTIVDRMTRTIVIRRGAHAELATQTAELMRKTSEAAVNAGRKSPEILATAGQMTTDAAIVAGQLTREGTQSIMDSAPVQQVVNSRVGKQAKALGTASADHARQLSGRATGQAAQLRGRAQQLWQQRLAKRATPIEDTSGSTQPPEHSA